MDLRMILEVSALIAGLSVLGKGVITDIKERRFPLNDFIQAMGLGCIYQCLRMEGIELDQFSWLFLFVIFNILGIGIHNFLKISAGDLKFLSVMILFLDLKEPDILLVLIISILGIGLAWAFFWPILHYRDISKIKEHYKMELWNLKSFLYTKQTITDISMLEGEELKKQTHPFTVQLYLALLITLAVSIFS